MGKMCWLSVQKIGRFHICFTNMLQHLCILGYVVEMSENTFPMSDMPMFFYEKTCKFDQVVNLQKLCLLKRHGKHFL